MKPIRLDKFLADAGSGTRSEVKQFLKKGLITVNGIPADRPDQKIDPQKDQVCFDGRLLTWEKELYFMMNKPAGVVSATEDRRERTVLDLLRPEDRRPDLFPAGRLDKDTEGLLLITNDGVLSHQLLSPRSHVEKTYYAQVTGTVTEETMISFRQGLDIGDEKITLPARLEILPGSQNDPREDTDHLTNVLVTLQEGRFHQIKRMFHAAGCEVVYLKRLSMGSLILDEGLAEGSYRRLTDQEISQLKESKSRKQHAHTDR